jgi:hypothetical protein
MERSHVLKYFVDEYFDGSPERAALATGYEVRQIRKWLDGSTQPQHQSLEFVAHAALAPEFKVVVEFSEFSPEYPVKTQLRDSLGNNGDLTGIYAFYDSMMNVLYVGKTEWSLLEERRCSS